MRTLALVLSGLWLLCLGVEAKKENRDRPRNVTLEAIDSTKIQIYWQAPRSQTRCPVMRYIIRLKDDKDSESEAERIDGNRTSYVLHGLKPDTKYFVRLVAVGCRGKSVPTKWVKTKTLPGDGSVGDFMGDGKAIRVEDKVPGKPSEVRTRTLTDSIILSWEAPSDNVLVRGYMVGYGEGVPDVNWQYVDANTKTFTIRNLKPSTQYVISLRAFNNYGKGPVVYDLIYTREEHGPTPGPLAPPIGLLSKVLSPSTVWLQWQDPSLGRAQKITDDRYYIVSYSAQPKGKVETMTVKALNVVVYDLQPATTYEFRVKTRKQTAETTYSISAYNTTFESAPTSAPTMLTTHMTDSHSVRLSWQPPKQPNGVITAYLIFYTSHRTNRERDWVVEGVLGDIFQVTVRDLSPNTTYYFKIQARNSKGYGPSSDTISYHTPPDMSTPAMPVTEDPEHKMAVEQVKFEDDADDGDDADGDEEPGDYDDDEEDGEEGEDDDVMYQPEETDKPYALPQVDADTVTPPMMTSPESHDINLHMLVRHQVSAVLAWTDPDTADFSHYHLAYHEENEVNTQNLMTSQLPVFVIDGLRPNTLYLYELRKEGSTNNIVWRRSGTIDTSSGIK